ncbi:MAG: hypothetical protein ACI9N0_002759, partial [Ilumatobacter sp.]
MVLTRPRGYSSGPAPPVSALILAFVKMRGAQ